MQPNATTDAFVGSVAVVAGLVFIIAAAGPWRAFFRLPTVAACARRFGEGRARLGLAVLGALLVVIGGGVIRGLSLWVRIAR